MKPKTKKPRSERATSSSAVMRPKWTTRIVTEETPSTSHARANGWGENACLVNIAGPRPMNIAIERDSKVQLSIHVTEEGQLTITDHGHLCYQLNLGQTTLYPARPWLRAT